MRGKIREGYNPLGDNDKPKVCILTGEETNRFYKGKPLSKNGMSKLHFLRDSLEIEYNKKFNNTIKLTTNYIFQQFLSGEDLDKELEELRENKTLTEDTPFDGEEAE